MCLMEFEDGEDIVRLSCRHMYHPPCIQQWLQRSTKCPSCRHDLVPWAVSAGHMDAPTSGRRQAAAEQHAPPSAESLQQPPPPPNSQPMAAATTVRVRPASS